MAVELEGHRRAEKSSPVALALEEASFDTLKEYGSCKVYHHISSMFFFLL